VPRVRVLRLVVLVLVLLMLVLVGLPSLLAAVFLLLVVVRLLPMPTRGKDGGRSYDGSSGGDGKRGIEGGGRSGDNELVLWLRINFEVTAIDRNRSDGVGLVTRRRREYNNGGDGQENQKEAHDGH